MERKIDRVEKLIKEALGEDTESRRAYVAYNSNRCLVHPVVLDYIATIYVNEIDKESDNNICRRLLKELEETKKNVESDIDRPKSKIKGDKKRMKVGYVQGVRRQMHLMLDSVVVVLKNCI